MYGIVQHIMAREGMIIVQDTVTITGVERDKFVALQHDVLHSFVGCCGLHLPDENFVKKTHCSPLGVML